MTQAERILFGEDAPPVVAARRSSCSLRSRAAQGVALAEQALAKASPFALAFVDMRMPPGWDGLETIEHLWAADPDVQVVICSAHSDYDWADFIERLGHSDKLLVLKKPFEPIEVLQCASALTRKWQDEQSGAEPGRVARTHGGGAHRWDWKPPTISCVTSPRTMR